MPWMPDNVPSLPNGPTNVQKNSAPTNRVDIQAIEKRILSSSEHLNEILALNVLVTVHVFGDNVDG
jgi:hypothetical protein